MPEAPIVGVDALAEDQPREDPAGVRCHISPSKPRKLIWREQSKVIGIGMSVRDRLVGKPVSAKVHSRGGEGCAFQKGGKKRKLQGCLVRKAGVKVEEIPKRRA